MAYTNPIPWLELNFGKHNCLEQIQFVGGANSSDVLLNHGQKSVSAPAVVRSACSSVPQSEDGKWNKFGGRLAWDKSAICCNNPVFGGTGSGKTGEDYVAAPNIDHTQVLGTP